MDLVAYTPRPACLFETSSSQMPSFRTSSSFARAPWPVLVESDHDVTISQMNTSRKLNIESGFQFYGDWVQLGGNAGLGRIWHTNLVHCTPIIDLPPFTQEETPFGTSQPGLWPPNLFLPIGIGGQYFRQPRRTWHSAILSAALS